MNPEQQSIGGQATDSPLSSSSPSPSTTTTTDSHTSAPSPPIAFESLNEKIQLGYPTTLSPASSSSTTTTVSTLAGLGNDNHHDSDTHSLEREKKLDLESSTFAIQEESMKPSSNHQGPPFFDPEEEPKYGWVIVAASFCIQTIVIGGVINGYGVFENRYLMVEYKDHTAFELSWIGTLAIAGMNLLGPFSGTFADYYGYRPSAMLGTVITGCALLATSFATKVWQLYLCQGLLYGLGASLCFFTSLTLPSQWFKRRRGLATGITVAGGGVGGLFLSPLITALFQLIGYSWTVRVLALIHVAVMLPAAFFFKNRVEIGKDRAERLRGVAYEDMCEQDQIKAKRMLVDFSAMKDKRFLMLFGVGVMAAMGYFCPFYYFPNFAVMSGTTTSTSSILIGILNGSSAVGRVMMGLASDSIGDVNCLLISLVCSSLSILLLWMFSASSVPLMVVFCIAYGFMCGGYVSLLPTVAAHLCGLGRLASVTGIIYGGVAIGTMIGTPTAGQLLDVVGHHTNFTPLQIFAGSVMMVGAGIAFTLKMTMHPKFFGRI